MAEEYKKANTNNSNNPSVASNAAVRNNSSNNNNNSGQGNQNATANNSQGNGYNTRSRNFNNNNRKQSFNNRGNNNRPRGPCPVCKKEGHWKVDCPQLQKGLAPNQTNQNQPNNTQSMGLGVLYGDGVQCYLLIYINGEPYRVLMDSGASISIIGESMVPAGMKVKPVCETINAANKSSIKITGYVMLTYRLEQSGTEYSHFVAVSPDLEDLIFGIKWLKEMKCVWDIASGTAILDHLGWHPR